MMAQRRFPNSVMLVAGPDAGEIPESLGGELIAASPTCIAIGTASEMDGATTVEIARSSNHCGRDGFMQAFTGEIAVLDSELCVLDIELNVVLTMPVSANRLKLSVFVNHRSEPSQILIEFSECES